MASTAFDDDRIGPRLTLDDLALPPHVGERLAAFYGRDGRLTDAAEWVSAMETALREEVGDVDPGEVMCTAPDGAHAVDVGGEEQSYVCVLDPLVVPFLRGEPATVRSTTPVDGETVTVEVTADGATATPDEAVLSLGVAHGAADGEPTVAAAYEQLCAYTHAFASGDEYERWAATVDAATTSLPAETGVALARELVAAVDVDA